MRVYISGKITGNKEYKKDFLEVEKNLLSMGYDVVNPTRMEEHYNGLSYDDFMDIDMVLLRGCDAIYMIKGWKSSCGANREYGYALAAGMRIMRED